MKKKLRVMIPKGHMFEEVVQLVGECGLRLSGNGRSYHPATSDPEVEVKVLKPQNIAKLIELGRHDAGFTGQDWITETRSKVVEVLDTGLNPVRIVVAVPEATSLKDLGRREVIAASEYERITKEYVARRGWRCVFLRSFGATEVFPPDDADLIVDNCASGQTLKDNQLKIVEELFPSSTRFIASPSAMKNVALKAKIEGLATLMHAVLEGRRRVLLEMNVPADRLDRVVKILPAMKSPTIQSLYGEQGYAVKVAVLRTQVPLLVPMLKRMGVSDILEYDLRKVAP